MARVHIPPADIPLVDMTTGRITTDWYDVFKSIERIGLADLADVTTALPSAGNTTRWNATSKKFDFGA